MGASAMRFFTVIEPICRGENRLGYFLFAMILRSFSEKDQGQHRCRYGQNKLLSALLYLYFSKNDSFRQIGCIDGRIDLVDG
jgi:hypothetical protein